jgi:hypothetical protein
MTVAKTQPSLAAEIKRASRDLEVDTGGRVWYKPTNTPLFRIAERDGTVWLQTLRGHDIGPASDRKDFWEAVNAVANLAFRLEELADAAQVKKKDIVLDRVGNAILARAGDVEYRYSIEARPGKPWKLSDSIVIAGEERRLDFKAIKPVLKKAAEKKPAKKAGPVEDKAAELPPPPPPAAEKPSPVVDVEKTEETEPRKAEPDHDMPEQVVTGDEEPGRAVAVLDGELGRKLFTAFAEINANRLYVELGDNKLVVYALDPSHAMLVRFHISRSGMKSYSLGGKALSLQSISYEPRFGHVLDDLANQYIYDAVRLTINPEKLEIMLLKGSRMVTKETMKGVTDQIFLQGVKWRHHFTVEVDDAREVIRHVDKISDSVIFVATEQNPAHLYLRAVYNYGTNLGYVSKLRISDAAIPSKFAVTYSVPYLRRVFDTIGLFTDGVVSVDIAGGKVLHEYDLATALRVSHVHDGLLVEVLLAPKIEDDEEKFVKMLSQELGRISSVPAYESVRRYAEVLENRGADITLSVQWPKELAGYIKVVDMLSSNTYIYIQKDVVWFTAAGRYTSARVETRAVLSFGGVKVEGIETGYIQAELGNDILYIMSRFLPRASFAPYLSYYKKSEDKAKLYFSIEDNEGNRHIFETSVSPHISYDYDKMAPEEWLRPSGVRTLYRGELEADEVKNVLSKDRQMTKLVVNKDGGLSLKNLAVDVRLPVKRLYVSEDALELVGEKSEKYLYLSELREAVARLGRISDNLIIEILEIRSGSTSAGDRLKLSIYAEDVDTRTKAAVHL